MYAAISGLEANQTMLDVTANDLANVNTVGYKARRHHFRRLADPDHCADPPAPTAQPAARTRSRSASACRSPRSINEMGAGAFQPTGNPLDVAIEGNGFLRVGNGTPPTKRRTRPASRRRSTTPAPAT